MLPMKKAFTLVVAVWVAVASGVTFEGGLWKEFVYETPDMMPVVFGGESRSVKAVPGEYCIYLDIWYADGTPVWGRCAHWTPGTHDWEKTRGVFIPKKPVPSRLSAAGLRNGRVSQSRA